MNLNAVDLAGVVYRLGIGERIKIWDKVTGNILYDNQMGGGDAADPTTAIAGGSIVIHSNYLTSSFAQSG